MQESLVKIAKKLKKNNVAVDIVSFGSEEENTEKLDAFLEAVNSGDNSHLVKSNQCAWPADQVAWLGHVAWHSSLSVLSTPGSATVSGVSSPFGEL